METKPKVGSTHLSMLTDVYCYRSSSGEIVFDKCKDDREHLVDAPPHSGTERRTCRSYLNDMLPETSMNKCGTFKIMITFTPQDQEPSDD